MRISTIKTAFHITGAAALIFSSFFILFAVDEGSAAATIPLVVGLVMMTGAIYFLAGAPQIVEALKRRFPSDGARRESAPKPRHLLKAAIGIGVGLIFAALPALVVVPGFADFGDGLLLCGFLSPLFATWGAAHLSWHRGTSPLIPIVVCCVGVPVLMIVVRIDQTMALVSYVLMTIAPILVVFAIQPKQRRRRSGR